MNKKRIIIISVIILIITAVYVISRQIPVMLTKVVDLDPKKCSSIQITDVTKGKAVITKENYIIEDFINKLSGYAIKRDSIDNIDSKLFKGKYFKVDMVYIDGRMITIIDNNYIIVDDVKYKITKSIIDLEKFYRFID